MTSDHKLSGLPSQFLWVGMSGHSLAGSSAQGLSKAVTKASAGVSAEGSSGEGSSSKCMRLLAGRGSSVPNWPHPGGPLRPQLPGPLPPPHSQHRGRQTNQEGSRVDYRMEVAPHPLLIGSEPCVHADTHEHTHPTTSRKHTPPQGGKLSG